jgi:hypothetical protein
MFRFGFAELALLARPFGALLVAPVVAALDAARRPEAAWRTADRGEKAWWVAALLFAATVPPFGAGAALAYALAVRPKLVAAARRR